MAVPRVIKLLGMPVQNEDSVAAEAITPGMLVTKNSSGELIKHATADGRTRANVALEREEMGQTIDDDYAVGDVVKVGSFAPGMRFNGILASGQDVAEGDTLHSAGNGKLKAGSTADVIIGRAVRAADASSGDVRISVEVQ